MKPFFHNPFTAPDIADLLTERTAAWKRLLVIAIAGGVLVAAFLGGYHLTTTYMVKTDTPEVPASDTETPVDEDAAKRAVLEDLQSDTEQPYTEERRIVSDLSTEDTTPTTTPPSAREDILMRLKSTH
jgi:hypothetical protein